VKTISLKKVSAVAVASLAFGTFTAIAPANAVEVANGAAVGGVNALTLAKVTTTPTIGANVIVKLGASFNAIPSTVSALTYKFQAALTGVPSGGSVGLTSTTAGAGATQTGTITPFVAITSTAAAGSVLTFAATANASVTGTHATQADTTSAAQTLTNIGGYYFNPTKAGTYVLTVWQDTNGTGDTPSVGEVSQTLSITVVAGATYSNTLSTAYQSFGAGSAAPTAATTAAPINQTATKGGLDAINDVASSIDVVVKGSTAADYTSASLSAEISGPGYLVWADEAATVADKCLVSPTYGANVGRSLAARAVDAQSRIAVCADGTSGVATVTIKMTDADDAVYTLAVRTVTFFGAVSSIKATGVLTNARAAGSTATGTATATRTLATDIPSVIVFATDKNGVGVTGLTITAKSSDVTVMNSALPTIAEDIKATANIYSSGGAGYYNITTQAATSSVSGGKATMTFRVVDPAGDGTTYLTSDVAFTIGGSVSTETISFDKLAYAPGEAMVVTITAKDSSGNPVYDGAASPAISFSKAAGGTAIGISAYIAGKSATSATAPSVFAPVIAGSFQALATSGNTAKSAITSSASVTDANAGLLTQIDALNAKIVALNALIAKIMKKLGVK
jgi:hypothetical protein